ncbi:hypothetical protein FPOAC2_14326 [Fusarium poae]|jgi:hypothetical protein|uniref:uncharacterized protein n=1 Tax=Fusarium poae TaxID=36050 RepID=UPI001D03B336|nr:uncharacterized protein FPOAC1_013058 [Fusarium poae]KAG8665080.1 hypothetical protein FPOAC1_013058 [Fusarium poae]
MATVSQACIKVPGLNARITNRDFTKSHELYTKLPEILELANRDQLSESVLNQIGGLIRENGLESYIGVHESHSHGCLADDHVVIGEDFEELNCRRVQQVRLSELRQSNAYGRLFALDDDGLRPYEYQRGTIPKNIPPELVSKLIPRFIHIMRTHHLGSIISLEILNGFFSEPTSEIVYGNEVTQWPSKRVVQQGQTRTTGFKFSSEGHSGSSNWVGTSEGHKAVIPPPASKHLNVYELESRLVEEGRLMPRKVPSPCRLKALL